VVAGCITKGSPSLMQTWPPPLTLLYYLWTRLC